MLYQLPPHREVENQSPQPGNRIRRVTDSIPSRKRNLARQRRRDKILVFGLIILFLFVVVIVLWVAYVHNTAPVNGP